MEIATFDASGNVQLTHQQHHFRVPLATFLPMPGGVLTPILHCQDAGCTFTCQAFLPLTGESGAYTVCLHALVAFGRYQNLADAAAALPELIRAARAS